MERDIERESNRKRGGARERERKIERSTQIGEGSINRPSHRGRVGFTLKLDKLFLKSWIS